MKNVRTLCFKVALLCILSVVANDSFAKEITEPAASPHVVFFEDFSTWDYGRSPTEVDGWQVVDRNGEYGTVEVVEASDTASGKALRIRSELVGSGNLSVYAPTWEGIDDAANIIGVEFKIKRVTGGGINQYVTNTNEPQNIGTKVFLLVTANDFRYSDGTQKIIGQLQEGWNTVRVIVNREQNRADIYLNDELVAGDTNLRNDVKTWVGSRIRFLVAMSATERREVLYTDLKAWIAEDYRKDLDDGLATSYEPIWIEYADVASRPVEWWLSDEALSLGERILRYFRQGVFHIGIPVQLLDVPDGLMSTQLLALARLYSVTGQSKYKQAFAQGINTLLKAQFPSGLWPTVYPQDQHYDLMNDQISRDSWESIPTLFNTIIEKRAPFDTDIAEGIDPDALQAALDRIPPRQIIRAFHFSDYAQNPPEWWASDEAMKIADNLLTWQMEHGGWQRIMGMASIPFIEGQHIYRGTPFSDRIERADFPEGRTIDPIRFMAHVFGATGKIRYRDAFYKALEFIVEAQYDTGGWPRQYPTVGSDPQARPFNNAATFYKDAIPMTLQLILDIIQGSPPFDFVDEKYIPRLEQAFNKGIEFVVRVQIEVDGRLTGWAQRYNPVTLQPVAGRSFEPVAINPWVTVGVLRLLQSIPNPSADVRRAILTALEWLEDYRLADGRWAMFYELGTFRPIFAGRDGIVRYDFYEIELERQLGYPWYGTWPKQLLDDAKESGYMDDLYVSLPDHPTVRVRFTGLEDGGRVSGTVPIDLELLHESKRPGIETVMIDIDGEEVYRGAFLPGNGELQVDTEKLKDGQRVVTVTTTHQELGTFSQSVTLNVDNWWRLVQNMAPPMTQGWFGTIDFLQTHDRSEGWGYETGESGKFYGDPQRLIRTSDSSQYLVWETHRLQTVTITAFIQAAANLNKGLVLETSADGVNWNVAPFEAKVDGDGQPWLRAVISLDLSHSPKVNWFRLSLTDAASKEELQIGDVILTGFKS